jgi:hypothetical protein
MGIIMVVQSEFSGEAMKLIENSSISIQNMIILSKLDISLQKGIILELALLLDGKKFEELVEFIKEMKNV